VPIERCARLIADVTGAEVSAGFVHACLARAAEVVADVIKLIKTLITAAYVAGFDETTLRCGPAGARKYVLAAVTELYSVFSWAPGPWSRSASSASCPPSPGWWFPTGTRTTSTAAGSTWLAIKPA
jgi:Transposase IS66 family